MVEPVLDPDSDRYRRFVLANTALQSPPHVPEIKLYLADEAHDLWHRTEDELATIGFRHLSGPLPGRAGRAWRATSSTIPQRLQTLLSSILPRAPVWSALLRSRREQRHVISCDIDPFARPAIALNADANQAQSKFELMI